MTSTAPKPYVLVAPNGARRGHADHPMLPVSLRETLQTAHDCHAAGADGLHLHVRDSEGRHSLDAGLYREALGELRQQLPGLEVQITTEAAGVYDVEAQFECLRQVRPTWASISVREVAEMADRVYGLCHDQGTRVQHILYDAEDAALLARLQAEGVVRAGQVDRLFVLGRYATGQESVPDDLDQFPLEGGPWMLCAFGAKEHACLLKATRQGGDVRVGFENSLTDSSGQTWANNAASVSALVSLIKGEQE